MKINQLLLPILFSCVCSLSAQTIQYQYSYSTEAFQPLSNALVIPNSDVFTADFITLPIGFSFHLGNVSTDTIQLVGYEGGLYLNYDLPTNSQAQAIFGYETGIGLIDAANTKISFITEGTAPNRIFKAEWYKAGFDGSVGQTTFQIWLYETSNEIQIHLGPRIVANPANVFFNGISPLMGLALDVMQDDSFNINIGYFHCIQGDIAAPSDTILHNWLADEFALAAPELGCTAVPTANSVFTFTPQNISAVVEKPNQSNHFSVYPNPAKEVIYFEATDHQAPATLELIDLQGRLLLLRSLSPGATQLELPADLAPGNYVVRRIQSGDVATSKLIIR